MVSPAEPSGSEPVDPDYASLFRPVDESDRVDEVEVDLDEPEPDVAAEASEFEFEEPEDAQADEPDDAQEPAAAGAASEPVDPIVDTGRLFRSQGVSDHPDAVLALSNDHFGRLRTLARTDTVGMQPPAADPPTAADPAALFAGSSIVVDESVDAPSRRRGRNNKAARPDREARVHQRGRREISAGAVYILVVVVTVAAAFADALLHNGDLGWLTGIAMAIVSIYCALTVTRDDDVVAIYTPPIAFLAAALTAGQLFLGSADKSLINRAVVVFFDLADNWYWIIGTTLVVVIIVAIRRRRA